MGKIDPYYGVLSHEKYRSEHLSRDNREEFFTSGDDHVQRVMGTIRAHIDPGFAPAMSVDFGCGTGRLVIPLSRISGRVAGIDVSDAMLAETRKNCESRGVDNFLLARSIAELLTVVPSYDFVHSYIVIQHIPRRRGMQIVEHLIANLASGGVMALHLTIYRNASWHRRAVTWARHNVPLAHELLQLMAGRAVSEPPMQMNSYDFGEVGRLLLKHGVDTSIVQFTDHEGHVGAMIYGRKS